MTFNLPWEKQKAMHIEETERLVTEEIEMLKVVSYLASRGRKTKEAS
jgi:hypothetical protein